jgi:hypothetical protein
MMARLMQQGKPGGMGAPPPMQGGMPSGPAGSPMSTPQKQDGKKESSHVQVHIAINMLEQALQGFGSETKEGKIILKTLDKLSSTFGGHDATDIVPAEIQQMVKGLPQVGGGTDVQKQIMQMMQKPPQQPGGMPQGMPPHPQ